MSNETSTANPSSNAILVTGAGSGIGRATALRMAQHGHRMILVDRQKEPLEAIHSELAGGGHLSLTADITDSEQVSKLFASIKTANLFLSGLVHCAGIHWLRPIQNTSAENLDEMLNSHLKSALLLLREALKQRLFCKEGASVVLVSSAAALQGGAGTFAYSVAKGGLISGARTAAVELARRGIRVNVILPGVVDTPQSRAFLEQLPPEQQEAIRNDHPLGIGTPEDIAAAMDFLLGPDSRWITGTSLVVDGGLTAH